MSMTDHDTSNENYVIWCQEEVDQYLSKYDWKRAQAVIDDMRSRGFDHHADILRKVLLEAQFAWTENPRYEPVEESIPPVLEKVWMEVPLSSVELHRAEEAQQHHEWIKSNRVNEG